MLRQRCVYLYAPVVPGRSEASPESLSLCERACVLAGHGAFGCSPYRNGRVLTGHMNACRWAPADNVFKGALPGRGSEPKNLSVTRHPFPRVCRGRALRRARATCRCTSPVLKGVPWQGAAVSPGNLSLYERWAGAGGAGSGQAAVELGGKGEGDGARLLGASGH